MRTKEEIDKEQFLNLERLRLREHIRLHLALGDISVELMRTTFTLGLKDVKMPEISTRVGVVLQNMESSGKRLRQLITPIISMKDEFQDQMEGDHAYEVYRLLRNFGLKPTEWLREFNDTHGFDTNKSPQQREANDL